MRAITKLSVGIGLTIGVTGFVLFLNYILLYLGYTAFSLSQETSALVLLASVEIISITVGVYPFLDKKRLNALSSLI
jgi:hypothetical protein